MEGHKEDTPSNTKREEDAPEVHLDVEEGDVMQPETESAGEGHPSSPIIIMASTPVLSSPEAGRALIASAAPRSSSCH